MALVLYKTGAFPKSRHAARAMALARTAVVQMSARLERVEAAQREILHRLDAFEGNGVTHDEPNDEIVGGVYTEMHPILCDMDDRIEKLEVKAEELDDETFWNSKLLTLTRAFSLIDCRFNVLTRRLINAGILTEDGSDVDHEEAMAMSRMEEGAGSGSGSGQAFQLPASINDVPGLAALGVRLPLGDETNLQ